MPPFFSAAGASVELSASPGWMWSSSFVSDFVSAISGVGGWLGVGLGGRVCGWWCRELFRLLLWVSLLLLFERANSRGWW